MARGKAGWVSGCWDVPGADAGARELSSRRVSVSPAPLFFGRTRDSEPISPWLISAPACYCRVACMGGLFWEHPSSIPRHTRGTDRPGGGKCIAGSAACPEEMGSGAQADSQTYM